MTRPDACAGDCCGRLSKDRRLATGIFFLALAVYVLTYDGAFTSNDERALFSGMDSFVKRGAFTANQIYWDYTNVGMLTAAGDMVPNYEPAPMVLAVPFYLWGRALGAAVQGTMFFGAVVTAAAVALLYLCLLELGYSRDTSTLGALVFAFATAAWPYSRSFFREPLTVLTYLLAFYAVFRYGRTGEDGTDSWVWPALAGTAVGVALTTKQISVAILPSLLLLVAVYEWRRQRRPERRHLRRTRLQAALAAAAPMAAILLLGHLYSETTLRGVEMFARNVSEFATNPQLSTSAPLRMLWAAVGLAISPYKGLFWFSPVLILGLIGAWPFLRRHPWEGLALGMAAVIHLVGYSRYLYWSGGVTWGSRYMMQTAPFLVLLAGPVFAWAARDWEGLGRVRPILGNSPARALSLTAIAALVAFSVTVQVLGISIDHRTWEVPWLLEQAQVWGGIGEAIQALYLSPAHSPVLGHASLLLSGTQPLDFAWMRLGQEGTWRLLPGPLLLALAGVAAALAAFIWLWRHPGQSRTVGAGLAVGVVALCSLLLAIYRHGDARFDPYGVDPFLAPMRTALAAAPPAGPQNCTAQSIAGPRLCNDVLVVPDPVLTDYFLNYLESPVMWYDIEPTPVDTRLLDLLAERYGTIWLGRDRSAEADDAEGRRGAERYLAEHAYKLDEQRFGDWARLVRFSAAGFPIEVSIRPRALGEMILAETRLSIQQRAPGAKAASGEPLDDGRVQAQSGDVLQVGLRWQAERAPDGNYTVFVQLLDDASQVRAQLDRWPGDGLFPTTGMAAGEVITDNLALRLDVPSGRYRLIAGMYRGDAEGLPRLAGPEGDYLELAQINVSEQASQEARDE